MAAAQHARTRVWCDQCQMLSINGVACHETGCPNSGAKWDPENEEWVRYRECRECRECGSEVREGEVCNCNCQLE